MGEKKYKYTKEEILQRTNGGLDVIVHYYPESVSAGNRPKNFSLADISKNDKKPSSAIVPKSISEGYVIVKEFNSNDTWSCFDIVAAHEGLSNFADICAFIFESIIGETKDANSSNIGYEFKMREAQANEKIGDHFFEFNEKFSKDELEYFGPYVTPGLLKHFNFKSVAKFHQIIQLKNKKTKSYKKYGDQPVKMTKGATDSHFIFCIDEREENEFAKIYTPQTKDFRFQYVGNKPNNHCFGLDTIPELWENYIDDEWERLLTKYEDEKDSTEKIQKNHGYTKKEDIKLPEIIIAGGDRDAINVASMGFPVVWLNSETAKYTSELHYKLRGYAKRVIQLGDIDKVGLEQMRQRALSFIDLHTLYLPESLTQRYLYSKPGKDLTDWVKRTHDPRQPELAKNLFNKMVKNNPLKVKFWDAKYDSNGKFSKYDIDNEDLMHFMQLSGFYKYRDDEANKLKEGSDDDFYFIKLTNNRISTVIKNQLQDYPLNYVRDRNEAKVIRNTIHRSPQVTDKKLERLNYLNPVTKDAGEDYQILYFKDQCLHIGKNEIKKVNYENLEYPVWDTKILDHFIGGIDIKKPVDIWKDDDGNWDVKILDKNNPFLKYLVNSSRIHWRKKGYDPFKKEIDQLVEAHQKNDSENKKSKEQLNKEIDKVLDRQEKYRQEHNMRFDEPGLTDEEIREQKLSFVNKWFAFGFYLHNHRSDDKPWFPVAMDNNGESSNSDSKGRSGKSFLFNKCMRAVVNTYAYISAADIGKKSNDQFLLESVEKITTNVLFDDANPYFPYKELLFNAVTGDWTINKKNKSKFSIKSENRPVPAVTSNHGVPNVSESFTDRMIFVPFADYYHAANPEIHQRQLKVQTDVGMNMFSSDFTQKDWLQYFNTVAHCIQFAMNQDEKVNPPMENVDRKNILTKIGDNFKEAADAYFFADPANTFDRDIEKDELKDEILGAKSKTGARIFKEKLKLWCDYHQLIFNPLDLCTASKSKGGRRVIYNRSHTDSTRNSEKIHVRLTENAKAFNDITDKDLKRNAQKTTNNDMNDIIPDENEY